MLTRLYRRAARRAAGDYRLQAGSPAIDACSIVPDINDESFAGAASDIGALESGMASRLP
jgi:hypothetical protein